MKRFFVFLFCSILLVVNLHTSEYLKSALSKLENGDNQNIIFKGRTLAKLEKCLLTNLKLDLDADEYYLGLRQEQANIENILSYSDKIYTFLHPLRQSDIRQITYNNESIDVFFNCVKTGVEDPTKYYEEELENFLSHKLVDEIEKLTENSLERIGHGLTYNFILTLDREVYFSPEVSKVKDEDGIKMLFSPNHAILSGNLPVITAGELIFFQNKNKYLCFISSSTGHYKTTRASLIHMKTYLVSLGIPAEAIICSSLTLNNICSALLKNLENFNDEELIQISESKTSNEPEVSYSSQS